MHWLFYKAGQEEGLRPFSAIEGGSTQTVCLKKIQCQPISPSFLKQRLQCAVVALSRHHKNCSSQAECIGPRIFPLMSVAKMSLLRPFRRRTSRRLLSSADFRPLES